MAKDGTARGGARIRSGRPAKSVIEKANNGNPGGRPLMVMEEPETADLQGVDMPTPNDYLSENQKNGKPLGADEVFKETWLWLKERKCDKFVNQTLVEQYAMSVARWVQCEKAISEYGFLSKHPTTGSPCASPFVSMSQQYMRQVNQIWYQIYQVVKENCTTDWDGSSPQEDVMERLLRSRRGV